MSEHKVLFVCTGNTCRSPMAEGIFRKLVEKETEVEVLGSAGVAAYPGDYISPETAKVLKAQGEDLTDFRSRAVDEELLTKATHVFAMTQSHLDRLVGSFPEHADKYFLVCDFIEFNGEIGIDVPDPIGQSPKAYNMVAEVFEHALPALLEFVKIVDLAELNSEEE